MIRTTRDGLEIEIDSYSNLKHLRNICKMIGVGGCNLLTIAECKNHINAYLDEIEQRERMEDEVMMAQYNIY